MLGPIIGKAAKPIIVYNKPDKHTGGFHFQAGYALSDSFKLKAGIVQEQVIETTGAKTDMTFYNLSLGYVF